MPVVSPSTNLAFQFTLAGHIRAEAGVFYLVCSDDTRLPLKSQPQQYTTASMLWHVIPSTDSTGLISTVSLVNCESSESDLKHQDKCYLVGRVVELGKRQRQVQFKVTRPGEKTLKLNLLNPDPRMKVGQLWSCTAMRVGYALQILQASPLEAISDLDTQDLQSNLATTPPQTKSATPTQSQENPHLPAATSARIVLADPVPPTNVASDALLLETGVTGWELSTARKRSFGWEWEAINSERVLRARVQYGSSSGGLPQVYQYPSSTALGDSEFSLPEQGVDVNEIQPTRLVVTPLGAALGIGASCFRVQIGPYEIVLDCGTRPKGSDPLPALDYLKNPDLLLVSHAHQDHLGAVPVFHSRYPGVRMICTPGTREIAYVMLTDCLKVQRNNEDSPQLFDESDLDSTLFRLETEPIGQDFEPLPGLKVRFIHAGHIVGAACIYLRYGDRSLLYTGDYNTASSRTTDGLKLVDLPIADILITESTYGADTHPSRKTQETALLNAIAEVVQSGGNVLIPAFALGRAQEILLAIRTSALFQKIQVPIYVDGLVRAVTDTFRDNLSLLPESVRNLVKQSGTEPFFEEKSTPIVIPISHVRERPLAMARPSVIVASSGMLTGGASVYYAKTLLERENSAIFISGYTDEESPGRLLQNLKTGDPIEIDGKELIVRAQVRRFNLSAHADKVGLTQVINKVNPKHLILIHGSRTALHELARSGDLRSKHFIHIPAVGEAIEYGVVPENLNPNQVARIEAPQEFEVEVADETAEGAWIRIPESVVAQDPRWQMLARNGVMKAKWEGFHLKLIPISAQHLAIESAFASVEDCCAKCQEFDFKTSRCQCPDSPLSGLLVDPAGYCLEYTHAEYPATNSATPKDSLAQDLNEDLEAFLPEDIE